MRYSRRRGRRYRRSQCFGELCSKKVVGDGPFHTDRYLCFCPLHKEGCYGTCPWCKEKRFRRHHGKKVGGGHGPTSQPSLCQKNFVVVPLEVLALRTVVVRLREPQLRTFELIIDLAVVVLVL